MKSVLFTILLQYTIFRRNFQENFFFFFYRKSELERFSSGLCGTSGLWFSCSSSHVSVSCRTLCPVAQRSLQGSRPATRRPLLKKGSIRKLYLRVGNILLTERQRIRNAEIVDFWVPVYGHRALPFPDASRMAPALQPGDPFPDASRRAPALHPATPFEKGVDPKTFLRMATYF